MKSSALLLPLCVLVAALGPSPALGQEIREDFRREFRPEFRQELWQELGQHRESSQMQGMVREARMFAEFAEPAAQTDLSEDRWFAEDKFKHFWLSFAATSLTFGFVDAAGLDWPEAGVAAGVVAGGAGVWKEFSDRRRGERFSRKDLVWDALGVGVALLLAGRTS